MTGRNGSAMDAFTCCLLAMQHCNVTQYSHGPHGPQMSPCSRLCMNAWGSPLLTWVRLDGDHHSALRLDMQASRTIPTMSRCERPLTENTECRLLVCQNLEAGQTKRHKAQGVQLDTTRFSEQRKMLAKPTLNDNLTIQIYATSRIFSLYSEHLWGQF